MTTVATRRMGSRSEETDPLEEEDRSKRSEDGEDDSGMVCDDVSGHMVPSSSSSRSSLFSTDERLQEERSKSDELLSRIGNSRKIRKCSGRGSDQSLNGRGGDENVFGNYSNDGHQGNRKTKTWGSGPVNVIVQHNQDGNVTTKAVTPTEYTQRDFTSYIGHCAPKSFSMNDIGSISRNTFNEREYSEMDAGEDVDDVDGVIHVRRMIRDNSMELFSLPECRAEPDDNDPHRSRGSSEAADVEINGSARGKTFKPLFVFPGGENIPERDYDTLKDKRAEEENDQTKGFRSGTTKVNAEQRNGQSVMSSTEYVGMTQRQYDAYHDTCDKDRFHQAGTQDERMGPVGAESPGNLMQKDDKADINYQQIPGFQIEGQNINTEQTGDLPDSLKNADMYESITGPTASKVEQELQMYEAHDYNRLIPELGVSEGSLAAGDSVLLAASGKLFDNDMPVGQNIVPFAKTVDEKQKRGFMIPKETVEINVVREDNVSIPWESNLKVSGIFIESDILSMCFLIHFVL